MDRRKIAMIWINVLGGAAVLGSYVHGLWTNPTTSNALWGDVPEGLRPFYTISMLLAAAGYFPLTSFLLLRVDPDRARVAGRFGFGLFNWLYALITFASALWMPLTFAMIEHPSAVLWLVIRVDLAVVGLASVGMVASLLALHPREPKLHHTLAIVGAILLANQTALLDALVWPAFYPFP
jgi:hypothetical protein